MTHLEKVSRYHSSPTKIDRIIVAIAIVRSELAGNKESKMVGIFAIGGILVFGIGVLTFFKVKWNRADRVIARIRTERIEKENIKAAAARAETGGSN
jgi:hypothetical protein